MELSRSLEASRPGIRPCLFSDYPSTFYSSHPLGLPLKVGEDIHHRVACFIWEDILKAPEPFIVVSLTLFLGLQGLTFALVPRISLGSFTNPSS